MPTRRSLPSARHPSTPGVPVVHPTLGPAPTTIPLTSQLTPRVLAERYVAAHQDLPPAFVADAEALVAEMLQISIRRGEPFITLFLRTDPPCIGVQLRDALSRDGGPGQASWIALQPGRLRPVTARRPSRRPNEADRRPDTGTVIGADADTDAERNAEDEPTG